ncbi:MAG: SBBP repeat-containing protein [Flammeovirgaceae bacterium]
MKIIRTNLYKVGLCFILILGVLPLKAQVVNPLWATFLGNGQPETVMDIKAAADGDLFITGSTNGDNFFFSSTIAPQLLGTITAGSGNTFIARVEADGSTIVWWNIIAGPAQDIACRLTVDSDDNVYLAGATFANFGITSPAPILPYAGGEDAFSVKFDGANGNLIWHTYIGTASNESGEGIEVDLAHNTLVVTGTTNSVNLPNQNPTFGHIGNKDAYCAKLNPMTGQLEWTAQVGTVNPEMGWGAAIDANGNAYVTGLMTGAFVGPLGSVNEYGNLGGGDLLIAKFDNANGDVLWGTRYGDAATEIGWEVEVNSRGEVIVGGHSSGTDGSHSVYPFPWNTRGTSDALLVSLNGTDGTLLYEYQYGGSAGEMAYDVMVDQKDNIYLSGFTSSTDLISANTALRNPAYRAVHTGSIDAFVIRLKDNGGAVPSLDWQTYYSTTGTASGAENAAAVTVDFAGNIYIAGHTTSSNFEVLNSPIQSAYQGGRDGFIVKLEATPELFTIAGVVRRSTGTPVSGVTVTLNTSTTPQTVITDSTGEYRFEHLECDDYSVTLSKNTNDPQEICLVDVSALANHVGFGNGTPLASPYEIIAADVDGSGTVTIADAFFLQFVIIGSQNLAQLWSFVPADYVFPDPNNPFSPPFPEQKNYTQLNSDQLSEDFIGIQFGDVDLNPCP